MNSIHYDKLVEEALSDPNFVFPTQKGSIRLEKESPKSLQYSGLTHRSIFFTGAKAYGLSEIHRTCFPVLRIRYLNQPENEVLYAGMEPVKLSNGISIISSVMSTSSGEQWIRGVPCSFDSLFSEEQEFVFKRTGR